MFVEFFVKEVPKQCFGICEDRRCTVICNLLMSVGLPPEDLYAGQYKLHDSNDIFLRKSWKVAFLFSHKRVLISGQIIQPSVGEVVTAEVTHWILML